MTTLYATHQLAGIQTTCTLNISYSVPPREKGLMEQAIRTTLRKRHGYNISVSWEEFLSPNSTSISIKAVFDGEMTYDNLYAMPDHIHAEYDRLLALRDDLAALGFVPPVKGETA